MLGYLNQDSNLDCGLAHLNFCKEDYGEGPQPASRFSPSGLKTVFSWGTCFVTVTSKRSDFIWFSASLLQDQKQRTKTRCI